MYSICVQIRRACSVRLLIFVFIFFLFQTLACAAMYPSSNDAWYVVSMSTQTGMNYFVVFMLPACSYAYTLSMEWESHASDSWIIRSGITNYTLGKFLASAISGFLCVACGYILFILFSCALLTPFLNSNSTNPYDTLLSEGHLVKGYLLFSLDFGFSGAITAVFGMLCSIYIMSPYTAIAAPLGVSLVISRLAAGFHLPSVFDPSYWMSLYTDSVDASDALIKKAAVSIIILGIMILLGLSRMSRRIKDV